MLDDLIKNANRVAYWIGVILKLGLIFTVLYVLGGIDLYQDARNTLTPEQQQWYVHCKMLTSDTAYCGKAVIGPPP